MLSIEYIVMVCEQFKAQLIRDYCWNIQLLLSVQHIDYSFHGILLYIIYKMKIDPFFEEEVPV